MPSGRKEVIRDETSSHTAAAEKSEGGSLFD